MLDNVLHSETEGDIHYNVYIPDDYDGSEPYALFMTLPGYQGLYFQGVGENVRTEEFGFFAQEYNPKMIIVAPQLNDWQVRRQGRQSHLRSTFSTPTISTGTECMPRVIRAAERRCRESWE